MSQYITDIVNNWSDRKLQKNTVILTEIYPLKGQDSIDLPDFKKDQTIRISIVKVSLRLLAFFGYRIRDRYSLEQIKPILREEKGVVVGLCNKKNIQLITQMLKFFGENNMSILSGIFCLAICKALNDCSDFKQLVWDNKVLREWLKTQKYLTEGNISQIHRKYFRALEDSKSKPVAPKPATTVTKPPVVERTYSQSSASSDGEGPRVKKPRENVLASLYEKGGRYEGQKERMKILDQMFPASSEEEDEIPDPVPPVVERTYSQSSASSDGEGPRVKKPRENVLASLYEKGGRYEGQKERMKILDQMFPASSEEEDEIPDPVPPVKKKAEFKNVEKKVEQKKLEQKKVEQKKVEQTKVEQTKVGQKKVEQKSPTFECNICASEKNISQKVICPKCKFECCKTCLKRHLLSSSKLNPSCMNCNIGLSLDFVYDNTDEGFYNKEYRENRAGIILSMEKSLLPTTQEDANVEAKDREEKTQIDIIKKWLKEARKRGEEYRKKYFEYINAGQPKKAKESMDKFYDIQTRIYVFDGVMRNIYQGFHMERFKYIMDESKPFDEYEFIRFFNRPLPPNDRSFLYLMDLVYRRNRNRDRQNEGPEEKKSQAPKRPVFIGPCPEKDCKGYLDQNYICGLCKKEACKSCRLSKHEGLCDPNIVATLKMIDRETKRCPKCNIPIYRIEGCDQMWCTNCHTAFNWITGEIETGRMHNPHYYEWMRAKGGGRMPREPGDVRCGGPVLYRDVLQTLRRLGLQQYEELLAEIHSLIGDIRDVRLRRLAVVNNPDENRDLRINYLLGDFKNEKEWLSKIKMREKSKEKRQSEILILQMLADTLEAIVDNIYRATSEDQVNIQLAQLPELHSYVNNEFIKIEKRFKNKSFRLKNWRFDLRSIKERDS